MQRVSISEKIPFLLYCWNSKVY